MEELAPGKFHILRQSPNSPLLPEVIRGSLISKPTPDDGQGGSRPDASLYVCVLRHHRGQDQRCPASIGDADTRTHHLSAVMDHPEAAPRTRQLGGAEMVETAHSSKLRPLRTCLMD
jgi:hypothetical protein